MRHWIEINRAPVLTLWAATVAKRLGFDWDEALTLGRAVAGLNAYSSNRKTFVERLPSLAAPMARRTGRVAEIVRLFGHAAGGLPSERLLARLAMPISDNAILRQLKRHVRERADPAPLRAIAIDDWSWRKGVYLWDNRR